MISDNDKKVESSIPVQSRIDIRLLAEMTMYWESQGVYIKSMSQLLSWSLDLCKQIIESNGQLPKIIETVLEASDFLIMRELYQPGTGMGRKGKNKITRARQLENLRLEGVDPKFGKSGGKNEYRLMHNSHSVEALGNIIVGQSTSSLSDEQWKDIQDRIKKEELKEAKAQLNKLKFDKDGLAVQEKYEGYVWKAAIKEKIPITCGLEPSDASKLLCELTNDGGVIGNKDDTGNKGNKSNVKVDNSPRKLTNEELDEMERKRDKKDIEQLMELKRMNEGIVHKFV